MADNKDNQAFASEQTAAAPYPSGPVYLPSATLSCAPTYPPSGMPISEAPSPSYNQATASAYQQYQYPPENCNTRANE